MGTTSEAGIGVRLILPQQRSQQLVTLLSLTVAHPLGNRGFLLTGKANFPGPGVEVV
jgi:hypothetical protein